MGAGRLSLGAGNGSDGAWNRKWHTRRAVRGGWARATSSRLPLGIFAVSSNDFRVGVNIELDGAPWRVQEFLHVKPGKGAAFVRTKLKNWLTGNTVEKTFRAGESVDDAVVEKDVKQFTYEEGENYVFMDMSTFEELRVTAKEVGDGVKWLKEGMECSILQWSGKVIGVELPTTITVEIAQTDPGEKGNTASGGGTKPATTDTGAVVQVPLFVNTGDKIVVDTRTGTYTSRA